MGYRSEVRCLIWGEKEKLDALILVYRLIHPLPVPIDRLFEQFGEALTRYETEAYYTIPLSPTGEGPHYEKRKVHMLDLEGVNWKWYESYPDVISWETFMRAAPDMGLNYQFIRIGEEYDDVVQEGNDDSNSFMYVGTPTIHDDINKIKEVPII